MALVDIGAVGIVATSTKNSTVTYSNMDDNKTVKNFYYPDKLGFMIQTDPLGIVYAMSGTLSYSNMDDNKTVKNFYYPAKLGFLVQSDTLGIITMGGKTPYIFWS